MRSPATVIIALALLAAACGDAATSTTTTTTPGSTSSSTVGAPVGTVDHPAYLQFRQQPTLCGADRPEPARRLTFEAPADQGLSGPVLATMQTSCGPIAIRLDPDNAPETVNSFVFLARQGYFDGTALHRIVEGFVIQGGDPTASGTGNPGYFLPDEFPSEGTAYERGTVAMANAGAGTTGSQFFIVLETVPLAPSFTIIGTIESGWETIDSILAGPRAIGGIDPQPSIPLETVYIESVTVDG